MLRLQIVLEKYHVDFGIIRLHIITIMQVVVCFAAAYIAGNPAMGGKGREYFRQETTPTI